MIPQPNHVARHIYSWSESLNFIQKVCFCFRLCMLYFCWHSQIKFFRPANYTQKINKLSSLRLIWPLVRTHSLLHIILPYRHSKILFSIWFEKCSFTSLTFFPPRSYENLSFLRNHLIVLHILSYPSFKILPFPLNHTQRLFISRVIVFSSFYFGNIFWAYFFLHSQFILFIILHAFFYGLLPSVRLSRESLSHYNSAKHFPYSFSVSAQRRTTT